MMLVRLDDLNTCPALLLVALWLSGRVSVSYTGDPGFQAFRENSIVFASSILCVSVSINTMLKLMLALTQMQTLRVNKA